MLNRLFTQYSHPGQQAMVERLIIEAIRQYGVMVKYIPRDRVAVDTVFNEDTLSRFTTAIDIEVYPETVEGFEGNPALMSKFGDTLSDQITFVVSKRRWEQSRTEKLVSESGRVIVAEGEDNRTHGYNGGIVLEDGSAEGWDVDQIRPNEGDLIWFPMVGRLFEVKFVTMEKMFYQLGKLNVYHLACEIMEYSDERLDTGEADIDAIEDEFSTDTYNNTLLLEDGTGSVVTERGEKIITEDFSLEDRDLTARNESFKKKADGIVDFSEDNPFGDLR